VLGLGATVHTNQRQIAADDFFLGMFTTALNEGEVITAVSFPVPEKAGWQKFKQPASRFSLVGVFAAKTAAGVRVAVTGAGANGVFGSVDEAVRAATEAFEQLERLGVEGRKKAIAHVRMSAPLLADRPGWAASLRAASKRSLAERARDVAMPTSVAPSRQATKRVHKSSRSRLP
jgi:CO/xanthine dehydrogenase FAD-binding subunit